MDLSIRSVLYDVLSRAIASGGGDLVSGLAEPTLIDRATVGAMAVAQAAPGRRGRELAFRSPARPALRCRG
jgi:hypothetical protein